MRPRSVFRNIFSAALKTMLVAAMRIALPALATATSMAKIHCSPYSDFQSMRSEQLATLQGKITYVGPSDVLMHSMVFTASGHGPDLTLFDLCNREGFGDPRPYSFFASASELRALLNNVGTLPAITAGGTAADPFLSFSLANSQPTKKAFDVILDHSAAADLFTQFRKSLSSNKAGTRGFTLMQMGCSLGLNEPDRPTDVSRGFEITLSGVRRKPSANTYVGTLTLTNKSGSTPSAPVSVVLDLPINVTLVNPDGITCETRKLPGRGFINLAAAPAPGQSVRLPVEFNNPDHETLKLLRVIVLAGPGAR